jgi:phage protein D
MIYKIKYGDTLSQIAVDNDTTVNEILKLNPSIKDPNIIFAGKTIKLPDKETVSTNGDTTQNVPTGGKITVYDVGNNNKEVTKSFLEKLSSISYKEGLKNQADSISISLENFRENSNYWSDSFFTDRKLNFHIFIESLDCGVFNIDEIDWTYDVSNKELLTLNGLSVPIMSEKSIYTQVRTVYKEDTLENILKRLASIPGAELSYFFEDFKLKVQVQNEFVANVFQRLAEKYGAVTKFISTPEKPVVVFYGKAQLSEYAKELKISPFSNVQGQRTADVIVIDKNDLKTLDNIDSVNFTLNSNRKELKINYYDPFAKKTYTRTAENKSKLILNNSRKDFEIVKVTSKKEADIVADKVKNEPAVNAFIYSRFNPDFVSGNVVEIKNFGKNIQDGIYLIVDSEHGVDTINGNYSNIELEKLP